MVSIPLRAGIPKPGTLAAILDNKSVFCYNTAMNNTNPSPFIQNCAATDISSGQWYRDPGANSMLISITDPAGWRPVAVHTFKEHHDFEFLDIEAYDHVFDEGWRVSDAQAAELVGLLQHALDNGMNVIVHCTAGICRSGAVTEVGVMMGFQDTGRFRQPNLLVKHKMMKVLGIYYDEDEKSEPNNWRGMKLGWEQ